MIKLDTHNKTVFPMYLDADGGEHDVTPTESLYYLITSTGIKLVTSNEYYKHTKAISTIGGSFKNSPLPESEFSLNKINSVTLAWLIGLFKAVYAKHQSEVNVLLYYELAGGRWYCRVPKQTVSGASVNHELTDDDKWFLDGVRLEEPPKDVKAMGTIHSHASMSAFFSTTDDKDDTHNVGFQIVVGRVNTHIPEIKCRTSVTGVFKEVSLEDVFDKDAQFPEVAVPDIITQGSSLLRSPTYGTSKYPRSITAYGGADDYDSYHGYGDYSSEAYWKKVAEEERAYSVTSTKSTTKDKVKIKTESAPRKKVATGKPVKLELVVADKAQSVEVHASCVGTVYKLD